MNPKPTVIDRIEAYINKYLALSDPIYSLPIALWIAATYVWESFDAVPYMCVTSLTKQSGKTTLLNLIEFTSCRPLSLTGMTPGAMFRCIELNKPTLIYDETESLNSEAASMTRQILNSGYQAGKGVMRIDGEDLKVYGTFCMKLFALIGDLNDTLRDRSIIIRMKRGKAPERFNRKPAISEGKDIRAELEETLQVKVSENEIKPIQAILDHYAAFGGLPFLTPRDEEIWAIIFVVAEVLCPRRIEELTRCAVDISTSKTDDPMSFRASATAEEHAESEQYAILLLRNILEIAPALQAEARPKTKPRADKKGSARKVEKTVLAPDAVLAKLKNLTAAPWRKYRHDGLTRDQMADLLARHFGIKTVPWRVESKPVRVYDLAAIVKKANEIGVTVKGCE